jgi:hypothetical protein
MLLVKRLLKPVLYSLIFMLLGTGFAVADEIDDAGLFVEAFTAYQKKDYLLTIEKIGTLNQLFPDSPLQDVTLLLLARAGLKSGNNELAAQAFNRFSNEFASSPLNATVEDELRTLRNRTLRGEKLSPDKALFAAAQKVRNDVIASAQSAELKLERERLAKQKAEQERLAKAKADAEQRELQRQAKEKADQERIAKAKADAERREQERLVAEKAASEKHELERLAKEKIMQERIAKAKAEAERKEQERLVAEKAARASMSVSIRATNGDNVVEVGKNGQVTFEVTNSGKLREDFVVQVAAPAEYSATLSRGVKKLEASTRVSIESGRTYRGVVSYRVPVDKVDGYKGTMVLRAASARFDDIAQSQNVNFSAAGPLLRVVARPSQKNLRPGEKTRFRITLLNAGSRPARSMTVRVSLPPQTDFIDAPGMAFTKEGPGVISFALNTLESGMLAEYGVDVKVREDCPGGQELHSRVEVINAQQQTRETFTSVAAVVGE